MPEKPINRNKETSDIDLQEKQKMFESCMEEFFGVDKDILTKIQERVLFCKGHVRFFMHPVALESVEPVSEGDHKKVLDVFIETLFQNQNNPKAALTFLLLPEEYSAKDVSNLEQIIGKKLSEIGCLVINTRGDTGNLSLRYFDLFVKYKKLFSIPDEMLDSKKPDKHAILWICFGMLLSFYSIRSGTCYGGFIGLSHDSILEDINKETDRCLGIFIKAMRYLGKLQLDISNHVVYKDGLTRENFKEAGGKLKDTGKAGAGNEYSIQ
jgi:hypothetical protein